MCWCLNILAAAMTRDYMQHKMVSQIIGVIIILINVKSRKESVVAEQSKPRLFGQLITALYQSEDVNVLSSIYTHTHTAFCYVRLNSVLLLQLLRKENYRHKC